VDWVRRIPAQAHRDRRIGARAGGLTTAGAPGIVPRTDLARELITIQLAVDILAAIVLFGLFGARLAMRLTRVPAGRASV
jgi:hypothetical protein